jgi:hypothetical protein
MKLRGSFLQLRETFAAVLCPRRWGVQARPLTRRTCAWLMALFAVVLAGCPGQQGAPRTTSRQALLRRANRSDSLLDAAVNQLRDLPSTITTNLRLPEVVLDSTRTSDGQDVMAVCVASPTAPNGPINVLMVPSRNVRFRSLGVKPGDLVKYHAGLDPESLEAGFEERVILDLTVAQVPNVPAGNILLIEGGLNQPVEIPAKLEIWRYTDDRLVEISRQLRRYVVRRLPPVGWEPSADAHALDQIVVQLNQWLRQSEPSVEWQADPLVETLDADLAANEALAPYISKEGLAAPFFQSYDGRLLQEAVWLRDISRWAQGKSFDKLERAEALFDWTVRNIQLDDGPGKPQRPWQTLAYGHGTAEQRAWVFALLCRQQGMDVVMLALAPDGGKPEFWLPALLDNGQLYLFDTRLGLAVPAPERKGVATLEQVKQDETLLRQLDLADASYPVTAEQLEHVVAFVVADPFDLGRRVRQLEKRLTGDDRLVLSVRASELADQVRALPGVSDARIWDVPFRTLADQLTITGQNARNEVAMEFEPFAWRPVLWKARTRHFQGRRELADDAGRQDPEELIDDHRDAARLYMKVRPTDAEIAKSAVEEQRIRKAAKLNATYWQGLLFYDDGRYEVATHWLGRNELTAEGSPWASGARYNLARTLEAQGKTEEAAKMLEGDSSPQQHGNRLRAKWLRERAGQSEQ